MTWVTYRNVDWDPSPEEIDEELLAVLATSKEVQECRAIAFALHERGLECEQRCMWVDAVDKKGGDHALALRGALKRESFRSPAQQSHYRQTHMMEATSSSKSAFASTSH